MVVSRPVFFKGEGKHNPSKSCILKVTPACPDSPREVGGADPGRLPGVPRSGRRADVAWRPSCKAPPPRRGWPDVAWGPGGPRRDVAWSMQSSDGPNSERCSMWPGSPRNPRPHRKPLRGGAQCGLGPMWPGSREIALSMFSFSDLLHTFATSTITQVSIPARHYSPEYIKFQYGLCSTTTPLSSPTAAP